MGALDIQYHKLINRILTEGEHVKDRTGTGTIKIFNDSIEFDMAGNRAPLITTKEVKWKSSWREMLWFIGGNTNTHQLHPVKIWDFWSDFDGNLGPVYGIQWRGFETGTTRCFGLGSNNIEEMFVTGDEPVSPLFVDKEIAEKLRNYYENWRIKFKIKESPEEFICHASVVPGFFNWLNSPTEYECFPYFYGEYQSIIRSCVWVNKNDVKTYEKSNGVIAISGDAYGNTIQRFYLSKKDFLLSNGFKNTFINRFQTTFKTDSGITIDVFDAEEDGLVVRRIPPIDQLRVLINEIKTNRHSRRMLMVGWNPSVVPRTTIVSSPSSHPHIGNQSLPPCHFGIQCFVRDEKFLDLKLFMRSSDVFLGLPFNLFQYGMLQAMIAQQTGLRVGKLHYTGGDIHIYKNHIDKIYQQLERDVHAFQQPTFTLVGQPDINLYKIDDLSIINYQHLGFIKGEVSV